MLLTQGLMEQKNLENHFKECKKNPLNKGKGKRLQLKLEILGVNCVQMKIWTCKGGYC